MQNRMSYTLKKKLPLIANKGQLQILIHFMAFVYFEGRIDFKIIRFTVDKQVYRVPMLRL